MKAAMTFRILMRASQSHKQAVCASWEGGAEVKPPSSWTSTCQKVPPEQGEESCGFHVRELDFGGGCGHPPVEHGIEDGAASGQDEFMSRYPLGLPALPDNEPDVAQQLVVEEEGEALLQGALGRLPVVHGLPVKAGRRRGAGRSRAGGRLHVGERCCGCRRSRVARHLPDFMV